MYKVLEPAMLHRIQCRNRVIRSATWDAFADDDGYVTDTSVALYEELGKGGAGLIVTGYAYISKQGQANPGMYGIHSDEMIPSIRRLVSAAHAYGAPIVAQIVHCGLASFYLKQKGEIALAPSRIEGRQPHREMTEEDIETIIADFAAGAARIKEAGFDGVQLHGAHGYLFSQFHSPVTNRRQDRWGGSAENRRRFHVEVVRRVRAAIGADYPLAMKFGIMDELDDGATLEDGIQALRAMSEVGLDWVEISGGIGNPKGQGLKANDDVTEITYFRERAAAAKRAVDIPLAVVGGIRALGTAEEIIQSGDADFVSLSRPFIREPNLVGRWLAGDARRARCISCFKCTTNIHHGKPFDCYEEVAIRERAGQATG